MAYIPSARKHNIAKSSASRGCALAVLQFGKGELAPLATVKVNRELDRPVCFYYRDGTWDLF